MQNMPINRMKKKVFTSNEWNIKTNSVEEVIGCHKKGFSLPRCLVPFDSVNSKVIELYQTPGSIQNS